MTIRRFILCLIISIPALNKPLTLHLAEGKSLQRPYWFVFDLKRYPALDNHIYYENMVWQISDIRFHDKLSGLK